MSREDSQFKLRMPSDLRDAIEISAKEAKRSLNAEIVSRLEISVLKESVSKELITADKARLISGKARQAVPATVKDRILQSISSAVSKGHVHAFVGLEDLELADIPPAELDQMCDAFGEMLADAGYRFEWSIPEGVYISFDEQGIMQE